MQFSKEITIDKARQLSPLTLAFVGDAVQTLFVRQTLAKSSDAKSGELHRITSNKIMSHTQAEFSEKILPLLTEEESDIFRRARNSKGIVAKHSTVEDYRKASGLEAVFGYLYLTGQTERLIQLLNMGEQ